MKSADVSLPGSVIVIVRGEAPALGIYTCTKILICTGLRAAGDECTDRAHKKTGHKDRFFMHLRRN
jgi:hypothetical protein